MSQSTLLLQWLNEQVVVNGDMGTKSLANFPPPHGIDTVWRNSYIIAL